MPVAVSYTHLDVYKRQFPKVSLHLLDSVYPMGDEVVLIYEATGKVVRPGGLPIEEGIERCIRDRIIGALGVSGGTAEQDTALAAYGASMLKEVISCL